MKKNKRYTNKEDQFLIDNCKSMSQKQMSQKLGRTVQSVNSRIKKLGCGRDVSKRLTEEKYKKEPKHCLQCNNQIPYDKRQNKFCNHSCAATYNNLGVIRNTVGPAPRIFKDKFCKMCQEKLVGHQRKNVFCGSNCFQKHRWECVKKPKYIKMIEEGKKMSGQQVRNLVTRTRPHICEVCSNTEWMGEELPLEVDHIDGNHKNNSLDNLRLICPNCHAQTETYKGKNYGSGRKFRRERYRDSKTC